MAEEAKTLKSETGKWQARLEIDLNETEINQPSDKVLKQMENVRAYLKDSYYFLNKNDLVRAFEAVVYAWAILDTLQRLGMVVKK